MRIIGNRLNSLREESGFDFILEILSADVVFTVLSWSSQELLSAASVGVGSLSLLRVRLIKVSGGLIKLLRLADWLVLVIAEKNE